MADICFFIFARFSK